MDAQDGAGSRWKNLVKAVTVVGTFLGAAATITGISGKDLFGLLRDSVIWAQFVAFLWYRIPLWTQLIWPFGLVSLWILAGIRLRKIPKIIPPTKPIIVPYNAALDRTRQAVPLPSNATALAEIDEALALFNSTFDRKKPNGFPGWVVEDVSRLETTYHDLIDRYGDPEGVHRRRAKVYEETAPELKDRMLKLHGVLESLRTRLAGSDAD